MIRITVPATIGNLGPGFDILALATSLTNSITATPFGTFELGEGWSDELRDPARNHVRGGYDAACAALGAVPPGVRIDADTRIPPARGLGSSAAARVAGVALAFSMLGKPRDPQRMCEIASGLEGHGDNAAAAVFGGLVIVSEGLPPVRVPLRQDLSLVLFIPDAEGPTEEARAVVADSFPRGDAIFNASRTAVLVHALATGEYGLLGGAMEDRWHQEQRAALCPAFHPMARAAREAGAQGSALSGAGPSVMAFALRPDPVAAAMVETGKRHGIPGEVRVLALRNEGVTVDSDGD